MPIAHTLSTKSPTSRQVQDRWVPACQAHAGYTCSLASSGRQQVQPRVRAVHKRRPLHKHSQAAAPSVSGGSDDKPPLLPPQLPACTASLSADGCVQVPWRRSSFVAGKGPKTPNNLTISAAAHGHYEQQYSVSTFPNIGSATVNNIHDKAGRTDPTSGGTTEFAPSNIDMSSSVFPGPLCSSCSHAASARDLSSARRQHRRASDRHKSRACRLRCRCAARRKVALLAIHRRTPLCTGASTVHSHYEFTVQ